MPQRLPQEQWQVLLKDRYPAYVTWNQYEKNIAQLAENRSANSSRGGVRQGRALLAGLAICQRCGFRMMTRYQGKTSQPRYQCDAARICYGDNSCQGVAARTIDDEVVRLALLALAPASLEVSLQVAADIEQSRGQLETQWKNRLERASFEADRARRQYDAVEPENRLVARSLEQAWEDRLRDLQQLQQDYNRFQQDQPQQLSESERDQIRQLSQDLPALWRSDETTDEDRKQILRQVIDRVVVNVEGNSEWVEIQVHWAGGQHSYSRIRRPVAGAEQLSRWPELIDRLRALKANNLSSRQIADQLHKEGFRPPKSSRINAQIVRIWLSRHGLTNERREPHELNTNEWTIPAVVKRYGVPSNTVRGWIRREEVKARQIGGRGSRWIIQATPAELQHLVKNRSERSTSSDIKQETSPSAHGHNCFKRGSASKSAR